MELWRKIPGFELYSASSVGRIRNDSTGKILKTSKRVNNSGYEMVQLGAGNHRVLSVHWCVAAAFIGVSRLHVNHKNSKRRDNRIENLEWVTRKENMLHAKLRGRLDHVWAANGKRWAGANNPKAKKKLERERNRYDYDKP